MSTYGVIARRTGDAFVGRLHQNCGNPHLLGRALFRLRNGFFEGDTVAMLRVLVDEHPSGWSDIIGKDFALPPGFVMPRSYLSWEQYLALPDARQPQCYCHGERHDPPVAFTEAHTPMHASFLYLIDESTHTMDIYVYRERQGRPAGGEPERLLVGSVALDGPEPSWKPYRSERIFYTQKEWDQLRHVQTARALPEGWQEWRRAAQQRHPALGAEPTCVFVGWFRYAGARKQRCHICRKPTARFVFDLFGYEGIELDLRSWEAAFARAEEGQDTDAPAQLGGRMRQKLHAAQQQGTYRVYASEPMGKLCLADYLDVHLDAEGVGEAVTRRLRSSGGLISCVLAVEAPAEEAEGPGILSAFYTDALTVDELRYQVHPPSAG